MQINQDLGLHNHPHNGVAFVRTLSEKQDKKRGSGDAPSSDMYV
jgi:hypothetical protein